MVRIRTGRPAIRQAERIAEKLCVELKEYEIRVAGQVVRLTTSIGVAQFDGHPDYDRMLVAADQCLYAAKHGGRDTWRSTATVGDDSIASNS